MHNATQPPVLDNLQSAAEGLLFPSETDAPLVPFFWPNEAPRVRQNTPTAAYLRELANIPAGTKIKSTKIETFFRPAMEEKEWHNDEEQAEARRFQELVETIQSTLHKPKVFRVGKTKIDCYIVGRVEGGWAGLKTHVVET